MDDTIELAADLKLSARDVVAVAISSISLDVLVRVDGIDKDHVTALIETSDTLPPIVIHRTTMRVVDGVHRVRAAQARGQTHIEAVFFDGSDADVFVLAVRLNSGHGLPLSRKDRRAAVARIVVSHPSWSDRRVAALAGVSPKTVAVVRKCATEETPQLNARVGLDGRARPVDAGEGRRRVHEVLNERPNAPVREVAAAAGVAPATVSDVRRRRKQGLDPAPVRGRGGSVRSALPHAVPDSAGAALVGHGNRVTPTVNERKAGMRGTGAQDFSRNLGSLRADPSLRSTDAGRIPCGC